MKKLIFTFLPLFIFINAFSATSDTLLIGVKEAPPFLIKEKQEWSGISIELWEKVTKDLNYEYELKEYTLDNLIHSLSKSEIDMSINPLTVTSERIDSFNFTQPFFISNLTVAVQKESNNFVGAFIKNFFSLDFFKAFLGLLLLIFIFGFIVWLAERKRNPSMFSSGWKGLADGFWWSAVTMTTVGYGDKAPKTPLGRILGFVWMFTAIIVISGFTASIASSLTVSQMDNSIKNFNDLRNTSVATVNGSSSAEFLKEESVNFITYKTLDQAINALNKGEFKELVYDDAILSYSIKMKNLSKKIGVLPMKFNTQYYSFALPYNQKLINPINHKLIEILESSYWQDLLSRYKVEPE
jgi:ABC-type amino acid transport substrate-binding protein